MANQGQQQQQGGQPHVPNFDNFADDEAAALQNLHNWWQQQQQQATADLAAARAEIQNLQGQVQTYQAIQHGQPGPAAVEKRITAVADPGKYKGDAASCVAWCIRMRLWLHTYAATLPTNFDQATAVYTRLEGEAAPWAATRILEGMRTSHWETGLHAVAEVEENFLPKSHREYARRKFTQTKQGTTRVHQWLANMSAWATEGKIEQLHGKEVLLNNVSPAIRDILFHHGTYDQPDMLALAEEIRRVGTRLELLQWQTRGRAPWQGGQQQGGSQALHPGVPMEIGTAVAQRPPPRGGCFKCGGPHWKNECPQRQGGSQRGGPPQSNPQQTPQPARPAPPTRNMRVLDAEGHELDFEQAKALFFDMYESEKGKGKETA